MTLSTGTSGYGKRNGWLNFPFFWHCFSETGGGDSGLMKQGRKGGRQARKRGGGGGIYWSSTQNVNKASAKDLSLVVSALTPRRLKRNVLVIHGPRIGSAPLALPPCAPPLYRRGHCSQGSFVPLDFGGPPFSGHPGRDPLCSQATAGSLNSCPPGDQAPSHSEMPPIPAEAPQMFIRLN